MSSLLKRRLWTRLRYRFRANPRALLISERPGRSPQTGSPRLCLYAHYDPENRVAEYVVYYVRALHELGFEVVFITACESGIPPRELAKIEPYCSRIITRRNIALDFGGWKLGLRLVSWRGREQLLLANDSVYGPLQPLEPIFREMTGRRLDLWGLTESEEEGIPHLQSYFLVFEKTALQDPFFERFWDHLRFHIRKRSIILRCEIGVSRGARDAGWKLGAFADGREALRQALKDPEFQYRKQAELGPLNPTLFLWDWLLTGQRFPFLKTELMRIDRFASSRLKDWKSLLKEAGSAFDPGLIEKDPRVLTSLALMAKPKTSA